MSVSPQSVDRTGEVAAFLKQVDLTGTNLWSQISPLADRIAVEEIDVPIEGVVIQGNEFSAVMNLYLLFQYKEDGGFKLSESFLAKIRGHFEASGPIIDMSNVDTSAFSS